MGVSGQCIYSFIFCVFQVLLVYCLSSSPRAQRSPGRAGGRWGSSRGSCRGDRLPGIGLWQWGAHWLGKEPPTCPCLWAHRCGRLVSMAAGEENISVFPPKFFGWSKKSIKDRLTFHTYRSPIKIGGPEGSRVPAASVNVQVWGYKGEGSSSQEGRGDVWKTGVAVLRR